MVYKLVFTKSALSDIKNLTPAVKKRVKTKLEYFIDHPNPLSLATALPSLKDADYRWRIGDYRVLFDVKGKQLIVLRIQHRSEVYKR